MRGLAARRSEGGAAESALLAASLFDRLAHESEFDHRARRIDDGLVHGPKCQA